MAFDDTIDNSTRPPSDWDSKDFALATLKGALSNIPIVGGSAGEALGLAMVSPLAKRRDDWLESLAIRVLELQAKVEGFTFERLLQDDAFVTAVTHASGIAARTHQEG